MQPSKSQLQAITTGPGPAMILAGPGSGKTFVIVNRIQYLIEQMKVKPEEILVITFTKAAAVQMRDRFLQMMDRNATGVTFGTFHAVFFRILQTAYHFNAASILKEEEQYRILSDLINACRLFYDDEREMIREIGAEISVVKNEQVPLEHFYSGVCSDELFRKIYTEYERRKRAAGRLDFDDMMVLCRELFTQREDILKAWQKRFPYILIDEFQDINHLQYEIVRMLALPGNHLFIVGDDDQSIYRFRGAKPEIMLGFTSDYPDASVTVLEDNFRSTKAIISAAETVIRDNRKRFSKKIRCAGEEGESVVVRKFKSQDTQVRYIIEMIRRARQAGEPLSSMAVLTRTNTGGRYIAEKLTEYQVPVLLKDAVPSLYDHWIARDIFAYLRLGQGGRDRKDVLLIMNRPLRYLSRSCLDSAVVSFDSLRAWYDDKPWMIERIDEMEEQILNLKRMNPFAAINYIRYGIEYDRFLKEYARERRIKEAELFDILGELQESSRGYRTVEEWSAHIEEYRAAMEQQRRNRDHEDAVLLATLHGSKGLEFNRVFLPDVNEDIIPHRKASLGTDIEEERRLLYVGMTRAKKHLHISYVEERYGKEQFPSRFLHHLI
ncbi:MAG: ATP-dependent helicase [Lachnospiraceae bacterium]|nr:ATP-dependent helicase [Lachnospiraceae bacterium]